MRIDFKMIDGQRMEFYGIFIRFGKKSSFRGLPKTTILLENIRCTKYPDVQCDHLWFNMTKEFEKIGLKEKDVVRFEARVKEYYKGYKGYKEEVQLEKPIEKDYKLSHPTKVILIKRQIINTTFDNKLSISEV